MAENSAIEWTDATWNPVRGCTKVSPGCAHCYAETFAERFRGVKGHPYEQGFDLRLVPEKLDEPLRWKTPRLVFVNSMSDLFQDGVPDDYIDQVFAVMALAQRHTFQILTKRPQRMLEYLSTPREERWSAASEQFKVGRREFRSRGDWSEGYWPRYANHIWLGVSVENQHCADERIPLLLQTPAAMRFISAEPLLEAVDLSRYLPVETIGGVEMERWLDWVIVGGESGQGARPFDLAWARSIVSQCQSSGVPVFIKQLGAKPGHMMIRPGCSVREAFEPIDLHSRKGGDMDEWPPDLRVREFPNSR